MQTNDSKTATYIYSAAGEKLRVIHQTAVPNISVSVGFIRPLAPSEILSADSTDYLLGGSLTLKNGYIDKYLFDEGYCQATVYGSRPGKDAFAFYYYDRDHLGSVREVTRAFECLSNGTAYLRTDYYPSGLRLCDGTADNGLQPYKYNGKEFDGMHGLNTYDYGARQYNPVTARWDRTDPLSEKYYGVSPYVYCANNPVMLVDPDGMKWEDPDEINALKTRINKKIGQLNKEMDKLQRKYLKAGTEKKQNQISNNILEIQTRIYNLHRSINDIDFLWDVEEMTFGLRSPNNKEGAHYVIKDGDTVFIETSNDAITIHEITHIIQSWFSCGLDFNEDGLLKNAATNMSVDKNTKKKALGMNEVEAYQRQYSFDKSFPIHVNSLFEINIDSVSKITDGNGILVYPYLK